MEFNEQHPTSDADTSGGSETAVRWDVLTHLWGASHSVAMQYWKRRHPISLDGILNEPAFVLKNHVRFRAASVVYHVRLLRSHFGALNKRAQETWLERDNNPLFLSHSRESLAFLADDLHFNAVSLLDYLGNLTGHVLKPANGRRLKWNGIVKSGRDKRNPLSKSGTVQLMVELDREWVDDFYGLRSDIIHYGAIFGSAEETVTIDPRGGGFNASLSFSMPDSIRNRFPFLAADTVGRSLSLVDGMEQIALKTVEASLDVLLKLFHEIGGVINPNYKPYVKQRFGSEA